MLGEKCRYLMETLAVVAVTEHPQYRETVSCGEAVG